MQRQKTSEEIEQERRDEEFARKLQEELNASEVRQQVQQSIPPPAQQRPIVGPVGPTQQTVCPYCAATNHLPEAVSPNQQFRCGSCGQMLPSRSRPQSGRGAVPPPPPGMSQLTCQNCRCINQVPVGATTQFMCGHCYRVLMFNQTPQQMAAAAGGYPAGMARSTAAPAPQQPSPFSTQQQPAPGAAPGDGVIYEGRVTRTIQVRCGQCATVNTVKATGNKVEFTCTACQAGNEVDL